MNQRSINRMRDRIHSGAYELREPESEQPEPEPKQLDPRHDEKRWSAPTETERRVLAVRRVRARLQVEIQELEDGYVTATRLLRARPTRAGAEYLLAVKTKLDRAKREREQLSSLTYECEKEYTLFLAKRGSGK